MTELTCQQYRERAAELALDVLPGRERAGVLAHLDGCAGCRDTVSALTATADRLVELLPGAQPSVGFEHRVLTALAPPSPRTRRWLAPAAAALLAIALVAGGWYLGRTYHDVPASETDARAGVRTVMFAPLMATSDREIGYAYAYPGQPSWIYMSVDGDTTSGLVRCELQRRDGSTAPIGTFPLANGQGWWGGPAAIDHDTLASARLITSDGRTLATAHFVSSPRAHVERGRPGG